MAPFFNLELYGLLFLGDLLRQKVLDLLYVYNVVFVDIEVLLVWALVQPFLFDLFKQVALVVKSLLLFLPLQSVLVVPVLLVRLLVKLELSLVLQALELRLVLSLHDLRLELILDHLRGLRLLDLAFHVILQMLLLIFKLLLVQVDQSELFLFMLTSPADTLGCQRCLLFIVKVLLLLLKNLLAALSDIFIVDANAVIDCISVHLLLHHAVVIALHFLLLQVFCVHLRQFYSKVTLASFFSLNIVVVILQS